MHNRFNNDILIYIHLAHVRKPSDNALSILSVPMKNDGNRNTVSKEEEQKKRALIDLSLCYQAHIFHADNFKCCFFRFVFQHSPGNRKPTTAPDNANKINIKTILITWITIDLVLSSSGTVLSVGHVTGQSTHAQCVEF